MNLLTFIKIFFKQQNIFTTKIFLKAAYLVFLIMLKVKIKSKNKKQQKKWLKLDLKTNLVILVSKVQLNISKTKSIGKSVGN